MVAICKVCEAICNAALLAFMILYYKGGGGGGRWGQALNMAVAPGPHVELPLRTGGPIRSVPVCEVVLLPAYVNLISEIQKQNLTLQQPGGILILNNNTHDNVYSAVIMTTRSLREFTRFI